MSDKFEDRLATALTHTLGLNPEQVAIALISQGIVADPVQHQQDLVAIMDKQVRDADAWTDEFVTTDEHPILLMPEDRQLFTSPEPRWADEDQTTYHRRVTEWREVRRA